MIETQTNPESRRQEPRAGKAHGIHYPDRRTGRSMAVPDGLGHRCEPAPLIRPRRLLSCAGMIRIRFEGSFSARRVTASFSRRRRSIDRPFGRIRSRLPDTPSSMSRETNERPPGFQPDRTEGTPRAGFRLDLWARAADPEVGLKGVCSRDGVGPGNGRQDLSTPHRGAFAHERCTFRDFRKQDLLPRR